MDHHGVLSFNCHVMPLGLTGEVESDYCENLGYGMIAFAAFGAVGYSCLFSVLVAQGHQGLQRGAW